MLLIPREIIWSSVNKGDYYSVSYEGKYMCTVVGYEAYNVYEVVKQMHKQWNRDSNMRLILIRQRRYVPA